MCDEVKLCNVIHKIGKPCIFKNILATNEETLVNSALKWTPQNLTQVLNDIQLTFRIGKKTVSSLQFENECKYIQATVSQYNKWQQQAANNCSKRQKLDDNPFDDYDCEEYWAYADYKYMKELFEDELDCKVDESCIDWKAFGFSSRNAKDSTMWLGSEGSYTPCHFDTYGYNLVVQVYGNKRWIMFPKEDSHCMYSTRVPFEESTVYSQVNITNPDLEKYPKFKASKPFIVDLEPGDVLYVPHNWWHFVQCLNEAISINTWVALEVVDDFARLKEILSKTLVQSIMESNFISFEKWLNSSENYSPQEDNMTQLKECALACEKLMKGRENAEEGNLDKLEQLISQHPKFSRFLGKISFEEYISKYTHKQTRKKHASNDDADDTRFVTCVAQAVTNQNVINLISSLIMDNFLNNDKM